MLRHRRPNDFPGTGCHWSSLIPKAMPVFAFTLALTFDLQTDPGEEARRNYWLYFLVEETQRLNDLSKGNHLLRVTGRLDFSGPLSQPSCLLTVLLSLPFVIFFISRHSHHHGLNWLNDLCACVWFLHWLSIVCREEDSDSLGRFRDLFLFSSPDLSGLVLSVWLYLVFSQNQVKSQILVGNGGCCWWAKVNHTLSCYSIIRNAELLL